MSKELERRSNSSGRMHQDYQAKIVSVEHPKGLHMAQVRLLGFWDELPEDSLPWAEFLLPLGAKPEAGQHIPVEKGDLVWVDFPRSGDTRYPRITGSCYHAPGHESHLPKGPYGKSHSDEPEPPEELTLKDDVYQRFGIAEYKTAAGAWGVVHVPTGTRIEISKEGIVIHSEKDSWRSSEGDTTENVGGDYTINISGSATIEAGDITFKSKGSFKMESAGAFSIDAGANFDVTAKAMANIEANGIFGVKASLADFKLG